MWRVYKIWGAGKKNIYLSSAKKNYRQLASLSSVRKNTKAWLPSVKKNTRQTSKFFECSFYWVLFVQHSSKRLLAECTKDCTRKIVYHSVRFFVVIAKKTNIYVSYTHPWTHHRGWPGLHMGLSTEASLTCGIWCKTAYSTWKDMISTRIGKQTL
jgi:hypothetical protein